MSDQMSDVTNDDRDDRENCDDELVEFDVPTEFGPLPPPVTAETATSDLGDEEPTPSLEVRRRAGLAALVGVVAGGVATAYLARAVDTGAPGDWAVCALMGVVAVAYLAALVDARSPLLVADEQGVRLRMGRSWVGLTWGSLRRVEVVGRRGLRDGRLVLVPRNDERVLEQADAGARRAARLSYRLHGAPFAVPLTLANRVDVPAGLGTGLVAPLRTLADGRTDIVAGPVVALADETGPLDGEAHVDPADDTVPKRRWSRPGPAIAHGIGVLAARLRSQPDLDAPGGGEPFPEPVPTSEPVVPSATPSPLREPVAGRRSEVRRQLPAQVTEQVVGANALQADHDLDDSSPRHLPEELELRRPGSVELEVEGWSSYGEQVRPIVVTGDLLETIVVDDFAIEPADEPVIGPAFAAARSRLGLTVDQLADRTRIRPHVIESIEVDDFVPCGGDFYARGHIRTLARVLGVDAAALLASYDERYADAPVNARRVFEAELAHSGGIRATRGGPNWSVLVAAVMALVLAWSIARLVMDGPVDLRDEPVLNGSGGPNGQGVAPAPKVPVVISAPGSGARVIVRDGEGTVVFTGDIAFGASKALSVSPPVRVQATDGSITVSIDGDDRGALGKAGSPGSGTYVVR
jgi:hypothetical protein